MMINSCHFRFLQYVVNVVWIVLDEVVDGVSLFFLKYVMMVVVVVHTMWVIIMLVVIIIMMNIAVAAVDHAYYW